MRASASLNARIVRALGQKPLDHRVEHRQRRIVVVRAPREIQLGRHVDARQRPKHHAVHMKLARRRRHQRRAEPRAHEAEDRMRLADVVQVVRQPPGAREHPRDHVVEILALVRRIRDERLPVELVGPDLLVGRERRAFRDRHEHRFALHEPVFERLARGALAHETRVEHPRRERVDLHGRHHFAQFDVDVRQRVRRVREQHRNHPVRTDRRESERDAPGPAVRDALRGLLGARGEFEDVPRVAQEAFAGRGQAHLPAAALEQRDAERVLEQLDLPAERRLGHEEPPGRAAEMQFFGDRDEAAKLVQFNHSNLESIDSLLMLDRYRCDFYTRFHLMRGPRRARRPRPS
ncbi:conserved hypothetical protein [Burkholderia orbicola]